MNIIDQIKKHKIFAVIRGASSEQIIRISDSLNNNGIHLLEITMESKNAFDVIRTALKYQKNNEVIGAGTVLDAQTAQLVIDEGVQFIVSPIFSKEIIEVCKKNNVVSIIGSLTPTEIYSAYSYGADIVKVFPANTFGPKYLKGIAAPLQGIPIVPTGGVNLENIKDYYEASRVGVGIGSSLVNTKQLQSDKDYEDLSATAKKYSEALNSII